MRTRSLGSNVTLKSDRGEGYRSLFIVCLKEGAFVADVFLYGVLREKNAEITRRK